MALAAPLGDPVERGLRCNGELREAGDHLPGDAGHVPEGLLDPVEDLLELAGLLQVGYGGQGVLAHGVELVGGADQALTDGGQDL
jgi:hypothetical protein